MSESKDKGGWLQTLKGNIFRFNNPQPEDFDIFEIAHALAIQNRFNGHTKHPYSVAQHSVMVSRLLEDWGQKPAILFAGLMHDAAEAYIGDLISPLKRRMPTYQVIEELAMQSICKKCGVVYPIPQIVKKADTVMLMVERRDLLGPAPQPWFEDEDKIELPEWGIGTQEIHWRDARARFLERFAELYAGVSS